MLKYDRTYFLLEGGRQKFEEVFEFVCLKARPREDCIKEVSLALRLGLSCIWVIVVAVASCTSAISAVCLFRLKSTTAISPNI